MREQTGQSVRSFYDGGEANYRHARGSMRRFGYVAKFDPSQDLDDVHHRAIVLALEHEKPVERTPLVVVRTCAHRVACNSYRRARTHQRACAVLEGQAGHESAAVKPFEVMDDRKDLAWAIDQLSPVLKHCVEEYLANGGEIPPHWNRDSKHRKNWGRAKRKLREILLPGPEAA
jgi:DNA-directed RNA polymerase specialized sigma24 family protein